ncbi:hypothetical protein HG535_0F04220 [Zygotorulaspora mrakii]|uniref:Succinate dehydrogenase [ubiquinone] cytochrome b small subunit n=1 Tax=Zygotorulaspora mrakii TaxID=42260 RepID=A0A7H9B5Q1_ZYGMR|nr:uncharacterized protein HG535_0F04220 [Zygotorulaspora mrakii]QLG73910.1 hypothetical protein HG535_0F04220 [Zygotorulaspora mrakii]
MFSKSLLRCSLNRAAFHSSSKRSLTIPFLSTLPQKPGGVTGTPNDAYVPPPPDKLHGSVHWDFERVLAVAMVPLVTLPLATGGSFMTVADSLLASVLLGHVYVGFQSCIIDYIPKRVYGKNFNYAMYLLTLGSLISAIGIYKLETEENGLVGVVTNLWTSKKEEEKQK